LEYDYRMLNLRGDCPNMSWSLVAVETSNGAVEVGALVADGTIVAIDVLPGGVSLLDLIRRWAEIAPLLRNWSPAGARPLRAGGRIRPPLEFPAKVICAGANYRDHRLEMKAMGAAIEPFFFLKPPTTTVVGPGDDILICDPADNVDWEAEIAVVIGRGGRFIEPENAMNHVAGYTLLNDVSARAPHVRKNAVAPPFAYDWLASKGQDTFCPMGPGIAPAWLLQEPISFKLTVNNVQKQASSTAELLTDIPNLIAAASKMITLEAGDVIATGTPSGVGIATGEFLKDGDLVELSAPGIGTLTNQVRLRPS
jgi:2-keto-4-pentenoate hydratase/2-oxohepta-3-ene-1,7-dioic acid hydratase in catechol pathway